MKNMIYAIKDLFQHFFNWHGRLSKQGYWYAWLGVFIVNMIFIFLLNNLYGIEINHFFSYAIILWNLITFFPMLFAVMRRYHDIGKAGWKAIIFYLLGKICFLLGIVLTCMTLLIFLFSAGVNVNMANFFKIMIFSILLFLIGGILFIWNIIFLLRPSNSKENVYGKPNPFCYNHKAKK